MQDAQMALAALTQDGLSKGRPQDVEMLLSIARTTKYPTGLDLRKFGTPLSPAELKALNLSSNLILSQQFYETLTDKGRADPAEAAQFIMSAYLSRTASGSSLDRWIAVAGPDALVQTSPNNMAAGPCDACIELAKHPIAASAAPLGPLPQCPHPSQCVIIWRAVMTFDGEVI